jgi:hypothetical protein
MRLSESDQHSNLSSSLDSASEAGPSGASSNGHLATNGYISTNGFAAHGSSSLVTNGVKKVEKGATVSRVSLPGTSLYEDSYFDREEFVRLVIQSLRDVGYKCVSILYNILLQLKSL